MKLASQLTIAAALGAILLDTGPAAYCQAAEPDLAVRVTSGLLAAYDFSGDEAQWVRDRSGVSPAVDLRIEKPDAVRRRGAALEVHSTTRIASPKPAQKLIAAITRSEAFTVEAWIATSDLQQQGPARLVTLSQNTSQRNLTMGQEGPEFDVRLRTTRTSTNGLPSLASRGKQVRREPTQVVYTRDRTGQARLIVGGRQVAAGQIAGSLRNWNAGYQLALANELTGDRPWHGTLYLLAIYDRALTNREVEQNLASGHTATIRPDGNKSDTRSQDEAMFVTQVAPLLARHCLECHNAANRQGGLDLSRQAAAVAGGDSGPALVPGKPDDSALWARVAADEMPAERTPLSAKEKNILKAWIADGASWPLDPIDPAHYAHGSTLPGQWIQRLTVAEYIETVRSTIGVNIADDVRRLLPADLRADGFSNTAYNLNVDLQHVGAYEQLAQLIVQRTDVPAFARRFSKQRKLTDDAMRDLIAKMGKWVLRGPLDEREIDLYRGISTTVASAGGDFDEAVGYVLQAMLQSPRFIYRMESQRGDGRSRTVGPYELASRMSYIVWGGSPDAALIRAADDGSLLRRDVARQHVARMLKDPRAVQRSCDFLSQWLHLSRLDHLQPDTRRFPGWNPALADDLRAETLAFFRHVVWEQERPLSELFNAQVTFLTPALARHYGLEPRGAGLQRYDLSDVPGRGGLLTQGSILTVGGDEASMVTRGLFVLHDVLRGVVNDPPPCVDTTPKPSRPGLTKRAIALERIGNKACGGCHERFEPLAFGLERFDGLGRYHQQDEHGNALRDDGEMLVPGTARPVAYRSSGELMDLLAGSDRVAETITWKATQFALGRPLVAMDVAHLKAIHAEVMQGGGTYASLISAIVMSDLVQTTRTELVP